ncbi:MAG: hypothetical protein WC867_06095 [Candidatus Pacearchaeota archaeon]|jgi:hypothetical protein
METYLVISTEPEDRNSELGVMKLVDGFPIIKYDNGNRLTFQKKSGLDSYIISMDVGGESAILGELQIEKNCLQYQSTQNYQLYFREISSEEVRTYALKRALGELLDELRFKDN